MYVVIPLKIIENFDPPFHVMLDISLLITYLYLSKRSCFSILHFAFFLKEQDTELAVFGRKNYGIFKVFVLVFDVMYCTKYDIFKILQVLK